MSGMAPEENLARRVPRTREDSVRSTVGALEIGLVAALLLAAVVASQLHAGAYAAEFGDDEASHYISGLLIHDYLAGGWHQSPITFLKLFHSHYPLVGIGHWPPLYYGVEALWMLVFSPSRHSVLALSAVVTTGTAILCYAFLARRLGRALALFGAFAFIASPLVQGGSAELMLDIPVTLLCLLAALSFGRYLETGGTWYSVLFGFLAAAAMLVKGNGICLALLPPVALVIGRRLDLLRRPSFWLPVPIVAVLAGPWYVFTYGLAEQGFRYGWGIAFIRLSSVANAESLYDAIGPVVLAAAVAGLIAVLMAPRASPGSEGFVAAAALAISVYVFHSVVPAAIQDRYLAPALPALVILAARGGALVAARLRAWTEQARGLTAGVAGLLAISLVPSAMDTVHKPRLGLIAAAAQVWQQRIGSNPSVLIVTDARGEAAAIAELAMLDPQRPSLFAIRGSRLLGAGGYNNRDYAPRFASAAEAMAAIDEYAIPFVLYRAGGSAGDWAHLRQIAEARTLFPDRWELVYQDSKVSPEVVLFRLRGNESKAIDAARLVALSAPRGLSQ